VLVDELEFVDPVDIMPQIKSEYLNKMAGFLIFLKIISNFR
jgi:hypothetical protein